MENPSITNHSDPFTELEGKLERSAAGRMANSRGKLSGTLLGRASGATRVAGENNNLWAVDGQPIRFHSVGGGKMNFTLNPDSEPDRLIAAFSEGVPTKEQPLRCLLYGLGLEDCLRNGRMTSSKTAPGRLSVSLSVVNRTPLGVAYLPAEYTEATTVSDRLQLMDAIDQLSPEVLAAVMDETTKQRVRAFVLGGRKPAATTDLGFSQFDESGEPDNDRNPAQATGDGNPEEPQQDRSL